MCCEVIIDSPGCWLLVLLLVEMIRRVAVSGVHVHVLGKTQMRSLSLLDKAGGMFGNVGNMSVT